MPSFTKNRIPPTNSPQSSRNWRTYTGNETYTGIQRHYTKIGRRVRELGDIYGNWETYTEIGGHIRELGNIYTNWENYTGTGRHRRLGDIIGEFKETALKERSCRVLSQRKTFLLTFH